MGVPTPVDSLSGLRPVHRSSPRKPQGQRTPVRCLFINRGPRHPWPKDEAKQVEITENAEANGGGIRRQRQNAVGVGNRPLATDRRIFQNRVFDALKLRLALFLEWTLDRKSILWLELDYKKLSVNGSSRDEAGSCRTPHPSALLNRPPTDGCKTTSGYFFSFCIFASAAASFFMYFSGSFLKSGGQSLQQNLISCP